LIVLLICCLCSIPALGSETAKLKINNQQIPTKNPPVYQVFNNEEIVLSVSGGYLLKITESDKKFFEIITEQPTGGANRIELRASEDKEGKTKIKYGVFDTDGKQKGGEKTIEFRIIEPSKMDLEVSIVSEENHFINITIGTDVPRDEAALIDQKIRGAISGGEIPTKRTFFTDNYRTDSLPNGRYNLTITVNNRLGVIREETYIFVVNNAKESNKSIFKVRITPSNPGIGESVTLDFGGFYAGTDAIINIQVDGFEDKSLKFFVEHPSRPLKTQYIFDSSGEKKIDIIVYDSGAKKVLEKETYLINIKSSYIKSSGEKDRTTTSVTEKTQVGDGGITIDFGDTPKEVTWNTYFTLDLRKCSGLKDDDTFYIFLSKADGTFVKKVSTPGDYHWQTPSIMFVETSGDRSIRVEVRDASGRYIKAEKTFYVKVVPTYFNSSETETEKKSEVPLEQGEGLKNIIGGFFDLVHRCFNSSETVTEEYVEEETEIPPSNSSKPGEGIMRLLKWVQEKS